MSLKICTGHPQQLIQSATFYGQDTGKRMLKTILRPGNFNSSVCYNQMATTIDTFEQIRSLSSIVTLLSKKKKSSVRIR